MFKDMKHAVIAGALATVGCQAPAPSEQNQQAPSGMVPAPQATPDVSALPPRYLELLATNQLDIHVRLGNRRIQVSGDDPRNVAALVEAMRPPHHYRQLSIELSDPQRRLAPCLATVDLNREYQRVPGLAQALARLSADENIVRIAAGCDIARDPSLAEPDAAPPAPVENREPIDPRTIVMDRERAPSRVVQHELSGIAPA